MKNPDMHSKYRQRIFLSLIFAVLFFALAYFAGHLDNSGSGTHTRLLEQAEKELSLSELFVKDFLDRLPAHKEKGIALSLPANDFERIRPEAEKKGIYFLCYEKNELRIWTDNRIAFDDVIRLNLHDQEIVKFKNGWYEIFVRHAGERTYLGLLLLKNEFSYQNKYLNNTFNPLFGFPAQCELADPETSGAEPFHNGSGKTIAHILFPQREIISSLRIGISFMCYLCFILSVFVLISSTGRMLAATEKSGRNLILFILSLFLLRWVSEMYHAPAFFYQSEIFNPKYFASSAWLSSLGDLMLNSLLTFYLSSCIHKFIPYDRIRIYIKEHQTNAVLLLFIATTGILILISLFLELIHSLVVNSSISFNVTDIFSLNSYSLYSFMIIGIFLFSLYLLSDCIASLFRSLIVHPKIFLISLLPSVFVFAFFLKTTMLISWPGFAWLSSFLFPITFFLSICLMRISVSSNYGFSRAVSLLLVFAFICSVKISIYNGEKERSSRILMAEQISKEQDHMAEHLFDEIEDVMTKDSVLTMIFDTNTTEGNSNMEAGIRRLHQLYFNGYWNKYDTKLHAYDRNGSRIFNSNNENVSLDYFEKEISLLGRSTYSSNFYFITNSNGRTSYVARLTMYAGGDSLRSFKGTIIVEMDSKLRADENGFPDLFLSDNLPAGRDFIGTDYSFARYKNGKLTYQSGEFPYYLNAAPFMIDAGLNTPSTQNSRFADKEGFMHLLYYSTPDSFVVISKKNSEYADYLTLFSYLFAFFTLLFLFLVIIGQVPVQLKNSFLAGASFSGRIQLSMMLIVFASLLVTASGTAYYIIDKYNAQQYERIRQKIGSLLIATQNQIGARDSLGTQILRNMTYDLMTLSLSASSDFNIYDLNGRLLFSTQPKIFEQEVLAERMNAGAMHQLRSNGKSSLTQDEHIGNLKFIASYEAIRNIDNKLIGYLGLPYFTNRTELKKEISSFLVALINIYVLLFALALILSYIATERITQPLRAIRQGIGKIRLGGSNESIVWESKDEIGDLIIEYNRMVQELSKSAELLARSERETAWREMARQVAHEIKNPLTPMKLSVQHLQKAWNDRSSDMDQIVKKISQTLITQIDTLSVIASEFSNFAQMPKAKNARFDLNEILSNVVNLYKENRDVTVSYLAENSNEEKPVFADRDQLIRVFTNLANNAVEAIPEERRGMLEISLITREKDYLIRFTDNGIGINKELQARIFEPNFTTKNSGMGLGLAMVKNIVEQIGGNIWFETIPDKGTSFFITLPRA